MSFFARNLEPKQRLVRILFGIVFLSTAGLQYGVWADFVNITIAVLGFLLIVSGKIAWDPVKTLRSRK